MGRVPEEGGEVALFEKCVHSWSECRRRLPQLSATPAQVQSALTRGGPSHQALWDFIPAIHMPQQSATRFTSTTTGRECFGGLVAHFCCYWRKFPPVSIPVHAEVGRSRATAKILPAVATSVGNTPLTLAAEVAGTYSSDQLATTPGDTFRWHF